MFSCMIIEVRLKILCIYIYSQFRRRLGARSGSWTRSVYTFVLTHWCLIARPYSQQQSELSDDRPRRMLFQRSLIDALMCLYLCNYNDWLNWHFIYGTARESRQLPRAVRAVGVCVCSAGHFARLLRETRNNCVKTRRIVDFFFPRLCLSTNRDGSRNYLVGFDTNAHTHTLRGSS